MRLVLRICWFALGLASVASGATARAIVTPCFAHLAAASSNEPHAYESLVEWPSLPIPARGFADEKLANTVDVIAALPVTPREYRTIFSGSNAAQSLTQSQMSEIALVKASMVWRLEKDHGDHDFGKSNYKHLLQSNPASFLVIVGHNEEGRLHLLDGNSVYLDDLIRATRADQRLIFISCDSAEHVSLPGQAATLHGEITFDESLEMAANLVQFIRKATMPVSLVEVQKQLAHSSRFIQLKHKIHFVVIRAATVAGTVILTAVLVRELDPCEDEQNRQCSR